MQTIIIGLALILIIYFLFKKKPQTPTISVLTKPIEEESTDIKIIRDEILSAAEEHAHAIRILQSLARVDGSTSDAERNQIFSFLHRNGADLTYERHHPYFHGLESGEWQRSVSIPEFKDLINSLEFSPAEYKTDIYYTALAIVSSGGAPKKREGECLKLLKEMTIQSQSTQRLEENKTEDKQP